MNEQDINSADSLLEELNRLNNSLSSQSMREPDPTPVIPPVPDIVLDEDNLSKFILETSQKIIKNGLETMEILKATVANTEDSKSMMGYAEIITATNNAVNTLNAINIEKRKAASARQLKELDIEARKSLKPAKTVNNTLNLLTSRENIVKMLEDIETKRTTPKLIEAVFNETTSPETIT